MTREEFDSLPDWMPVRYKDRDWPYMVSKYGEVKNAKNEIIKTCMRGQRKGTYPCVRLHLCGFRVAVDVHRLVALHYVPNLKYKPEVDHKDMNHLNAAAYNLDWVTRSENEQRKYFMNAHLEFMNV